MRCAIIVSSIEVADMNIKAQFARHFGFRETSREFDGYKVLSNGIFELFTLKGKSIYDSDWSAMDADVLIFASSHKGESGKPTLTVHCVGNFGKAEMGGKDKIIVKGSAVLVRNYLCRLQELREREHLDYEVGLEVTHHGPYADKIVVYIELGSTEPQWRDERAAKVVAEAIVSATNLTQKNEKIAIALGGGHYAPEFTKLLLRTDYAIAHTCAKYALENFNEEMLQKMISATVEKVEYIIVDWKGLGEHKERVMKICETAGLQILRSRKILDALPD
jgi:D-aminoacyl-tRNA deacylase